MYDKLDRIREELAKARQKKEEVDAKVKSLEIKLKEAEASQIVADVTSYNMSPEQLAKFLELAANGKLQDLLSEGDPVPQFGIDELMGTVEGYATLMEAIKQASPVPIEFENIESGAKGYFHVEENRIAIQEGMSEAQTIKTALHEASHAMLHSKEAMAGNAENKSRSQKECEAESVAFVVCQHFGVDTSEYSFPYVAGWSSDKEVLELKASLETIRSTASSLITKIEENVQTLINVKEMDEFIKAHGDELPFGDSADDRLAGYVEITPPVDMSSVDTSRTIKLTAENEGKEDADMPTQQQKKALNSAHKRAKKTERVERKSVKDQISEKKEEAAKKPKTKQNDTQKLGEAI